jgi:hypothetical protein
MPSLSHHATAGPGSDYPIFSCLRKGPDVFTQSDGDYNPYSYSYYLQQMQLQASLSVAMVPQPLHMDSYRVLVPTTAATTTTIAATAGEQRRGSP